MKSRNQNSMSLNRVSEYIYLFHEAVRIYRMLFLICSQNLSSIVCLRTINLATALAHHFLFLLLLLRLPLALVRNVAAVSQDAQGERHHEDDTGDGAPSHNPPDSFNLGSGVAIEDDADFVGYLLNLCVFEY